MADAMFAGLEQRLRLGLRSLTVPLRRDRPMYRQMFDDSFIGKYNWFVRRSWG